MGKTYRGLTRIGNTFSYEKEKEKPKPKGEFFVKVFDYDGTLLDEVWLNKDETYTLPTPPTHERLDFTAWTTTTAAVNNVITITNNDVMVGATYTPKSGMSEFDIELTPAIAPDIESDGYTVTLNMTGSKYWDYGNDKTTSDTEITHTYYAYGKYTIACDGTMSGISNGNGIVGQGGTKINYFLQRAFMGAASSLLSYAFQYCYGLENITLAKTFTASYFLRDCRSLKALVFPPSQNQVPLYFCNNCYSLKTLILSSKISSSAYVGSNAFGNCPINPLVLPEFASISSSNFIGNRVVEKVTILGNISNSNNFSDNYSLREVKLYKSQFRFSCFYNCYSLKIIDMTNRTSVPSTQDSTLPTWAQKNLKIVVPDELYDDWIVATNWTGLHALGVIYKASEVEL